MTVIADSFAAGKKNETHICVSDISISLIHKEHSKEQISCISGKIKERDCILKITFFK